MATRNPGSENQLRLVGEIPLIIHDGLDLAPSIPTGPVVGNTWDFWLPSTEF